MPNKTILQLPAGTIPLDRVTKLLPYVDSGITSKISIEQLTGEYVVEGVLAAADIATIGTVNVPFSAAPPAGYYFRIVRAEAWIDYGTAPYLAKVLGIKNTGADIPQITFNKILPSTVSRGEMATDQGLSGITTEEIIIENAGLDWCTLDGTNPTVAGDSDIRYRVRVALETIIP